MPLKNGIECLCSIRNDRNFDKTPVIMYSTSHNIKDIDKCYKQGANFYIVKPVTLTKMTNILEKLFTALGKPKRELGAKDQFVLMEKNELVG
jgi:CheY-like chemotaxis protein